MALLITSLLLTALPADLKIQSLFLMQQNRVVEAIDRYKEYTAVAGRPDFEMLQQMGMMLLGKGSQASDPETFLMTLFGAGLSGSNNVLDILAKGVFHPDPQTQLLSLHFLSQIEDDQTSEIFTRAMNSDYLSTRMEAAFYLASRKHPHAIGQIEGLMFRLPPVFKPFFPSFFALIGTPDATSALRRLMEDTDVHVRIESILQVAKLGRDDFLPQLRKRLTHTHVAELEAALFAVSALKDTQSLHKIKKQVNASTDTVRLAAALAMLRLGDRSQVQVVEELAKKGNLHAIAALGGVTGSEEVLAKLVTSNDLQIRINAGIGLLERRDPRAVPALLEILIQDARGLAFQPFPSPGRSLVAFKAIPSAELHAKDPNTDLSYSLAIREHLLREALHLPEENFLKVAREIFGKYQPDLIPCVISLLENLQTPGAKQVLKEGTQKVSHPLIRDYCNLALFRLKEEGPYQEHVTRWVMHQKEAELIRFRPLLPWKFRLEQADYALTAEETSKLLIDSCFAIASRRDEKSIAFLLDAIQLGNPLNRYALMGLLMKATE